MSQLEILLGVIVCQQGAYNQAHSLLVTVIALILHTTNNPKLETPSSSCLYYSKKIPTFC